MENIKIILLAILVIGLSACATKPITYTYAPTSKLNIEGELAVSNFKYIPGETEKIKPNQIRNTALGSVIFEKNINEYIEDALYLESKFVGIKINEFAPAVHGEINEFLIDDLGFSIDWTLNIHYVIDNCYDKTHETLKTTGKFGDVFGQLSTVIKLNIDALLSDIAFQQCINGNFALNPTRSQANIIPDTQYDNAPIAPLPSSNTVTSNYPILVEELNSSSIRIMQQAAKRIGEERLHNDEGIILASIGILERGLANGIDTSDKYQIDGLAWSAINLGNAGDQRAVSVLTKISNSNYPKKLKKHALAALKKLEN